MNHDLTILIAEDSADDAFLLQRVLRRIGVGEYGDRTKYPFPSVLITDLKMPLKSGFELLHWLRQNPDCKVVPVIVLTSSSQEEDINRAYEMGANAYMCKPASTKELEEMMKIMVEFWARCKKPRLPLRC